MLHINVRVKPCEQQISRNKQSNRLFEEKYGSLVMPLSYDDFLTNYTNAGL